MARVQGDEAAELAREVVELRDALEQARRDAADARAALAQILESGPILIFGGNTDGFTVTHASANVTRILGYDSEEFVRQPWIRYVHPDDRARVGAAAAQILERDAIEWQGRVRHADGTYRWMHTHVSGGPFRPDGHRDVTGYVWDRTNERRAEERYRAISELTSDFAYSFRVGEDRRLTAEWTSGAHEAMTGYSLAEGEEMETWLPIVDPADRDRFTQALEAVLSGTPQRIEIRIVHKAGHIRWIRVVAEPVTDAEGRVVRVYGAATDITERKQAEEALARSEAALREAQAIGSVGAFHADLASGAIEWSDETYRLIGYSPESVVPTIRWLLDQAHPDDRPDLERTLAAALRSAEPTDHEARFIRGDGAVRWFHFRGRPDFDEDGRPVAFRGVAHDITDRKVAEDALAESEARFRQVVEQSPLGVATFDAEGRLVLWSPAAQRMLGWSPEEAVGQIFTSMPTEEVEKLRALFERVMAGESITDHETFARRSDGSELHVAVSLAPIVDSEGNPAGMLAIFADITERRRLEEQLLQAQKMSALGRLAGGVAHDFNNLLTTILGHAEFLADAGNPDEVREDARAIVEACRRASGLTEQMLAFSRHRTPQATVVDLSAVIAEMSELLERLVGPEVALEVSTASEGAWVRVSRAQLEQVALNLVVNARDATPPGGRVALDVGVHGNDVVLAVADTGIGMEPDVRARIFEPFFTTREAGTGLGLSVVYGVVEGAGGRIDVHSKPGEGTRFDVRLPRVDVEPAAGEADPARDQELPPALSGDESVLLVEDEESVRSLARRTLEHWGYDVVEASDGFEALSIVEERGRPFVALVTDLVMPGMSGVHLARTLQIRWPELKVLYMSGYSEVAPEEGDAHYLGKPFAPPDLVAALRQLLDE